MITYFYEPQEYFVAVSAKKKWNETSKKRVY